MPTGMTAVRYLIVANVVVFALQLVFGDALIEYFALWPLATNATAGAAPGPGFQLWQLVSSAFLHGNLAHIALNMFGLFMFGRDVETVLGRRRFLKLYFAAVLSAALLQLFVVSNAGTGALQPTLGASGGVFGVLLAFGMLFPERRVMLLFPPIPMPAWVMVTGYALIELANGVLGTDAGVAHFAHLGGMLGAYLMLRHYRASAA